MNMKVLLVSGSVSNRLQHEMYDNYQLPLHFAIQKYYKLMEEGFARNGMEIEALSFVPIPNAKAPFWFRRFKKEKERNVTYQYVPFVRIAALNQAMVLLCLLWSVFWWSVRNRKDGVVLCDTLIPSIGIGTGLGSALAGGKRIAWVTDMPGMTSTKCLHYEEMGLLGRLQIRCIRNYSGYVFVTAQTNCVLNPKNRPYMIMEGLVDPDMKPLEGVKKNDTRDVLYAGGLYESYGLGFLCEAMLRLDQEDVRLVIYGDGPFKTKIMEYASQDQRIEYHGTATNDVVVEAERRATLLVNPRFSGAEYTLYSFPSKNIEYMVSGTPIVTTQLAGIPVDYKPYIYTFDDETVAGYATTLYTLLKKSEDELREFGAKAQMYILEKKNATAQVKRLIGMIQRL